MEAEPHNRRWESERSQDRKHRLSSVKNLCAQGGWQGHTDGVQGQARVNVVREEELEDTEQRKRITEVILKGMRRHEADNQNRRTNFEKV